MVHRPFSPALKSHAPYKPGFGENQWRDHYRSSAEFCLAQTLYNYQQDPSKGFQVDTLVTSSLPIIFEYKMYLHERWHIELQGAVKFSKDLMFLDHPDIFPLSCKYGLCTKFINKHTRNVAGSTSRHDNFVGWKATNILSWHLNNVAHAAKLIHDNILKTDLNGNSRRYFRQLALMVTARKKFFRDGSKAYTKILTVIEEGIKLMKKERLEAGIKSMVETNKLKAFNKHWIKIQSYARDDRNYEILDDGERVFVVPKKYKDIYNYLAELRRKDTDDWRLKFLRDTGMNMDKYEEAREKRKQDNAQDSKERQKKARNHGHEQSSERDDADFEL